ncbi:hypothetical protein YB2330_003760 [Saitoella coloradoensis]
MPKENEKEPASAKNPVTIHPKTWPWPSFLAWVPPKCNYKSMKPVIRSSVAGWIAFILVIVPHTLHVLGQASFFALVVALITPPSDPVIVTFWRSVYNIILVLLAWAWGIVAARIATAVRDEYVDLTSVNRVAIFNGDYVETKSSVVFAVFLAFGAGFFLWIKSKYPALIFGSVFSMICVVVTCTYGALFPYFYPLLGSLFVVPLVIQSGINIGCAIFIYPETVNHLYMDKLMGLFGALKEVIAEQKSLLATDPDSDDWSKASTAHEKLVGVRQMLPAFGAIEGFLDMEPSYGRLCGTDLKQFLDIAKKMQARLSGLDFFHNVVDVNMRPGPRSRFEKILRGNTEPKKSRKNRDGWYRDGTQSRPYSGYNTPAGGESSIGGWMTPVPPPGGRVTDHWKRQEREGREERDHHPNVDHDNDIEIDSPSPSPSPGVSVSPSPRMTETPPRPKMSHHSSSRSERGSDSHSLHARFASPDGRGDNGHRDSHTDFLSVPGAEELRERRASPLQQFEAAQSSAASVRSVYTGGRPSGEHTIPDDFADLFRKNKKKKKKQRKSDSRRSSHDHHSHSPFSPFHPKILHEALHHEYRQVAVMETQAYMDLESKFPREKDREVIQEMVALLKIATEDVIRVSDESMGYLLKWLKKINNDRCTKFFRSKTKDERDRSMAIEELTWQVGELKRVMDEFQSVKRLEIIKPFEEYFQERRPHDEIPPYRGLFFAYLYEFQIVEYSKQLTVLMEHILTLEKERPRRKLWFDWKMALNPKVWWRGAFGGGPAFAKIHSTGGDADDDPEHLAGIDELPTEKRDPDADPPSKTRHLVGLAIYKIYCFFRRNDVTFAFKAGILVLLVALPTFFRSTAGFMYHNRGLWAIIMAGLTYAQFSGDTLFGFVSRVGGTLLGAVVGLVCWYISAGNGPGNPYGLAATMAVALIPILFIRVYHVYLTPMPAIIFTITVALTIGYSWQDSYNPTLGTVGIGWEVAWRRFLCVVIGITAAFIWSFVPTPKTGRFQLRLTFARTITEIGAMHCQLSNYARKKHPDNVPDAELLKMALAVMAKLAQANLRLGFAKFEPPIQGRWPAEKYQQLLSVQMELVQLMTSLMNVFMQLDQKWTRALLIRTGWLDPHFVADQLATIYMVSTALKTGSSLPQIVPSPLVDRFYQRIYGLKVVWGDEDDEDDDGLPRHIDYETLQQREYALFAVGCTLTSGIVLRLDKLMWICKSLVGEIYSLPGYYRDTRMRHERHPLFQDKFTDEAV